MTGPPSGDPLDPRSIGPGDRYAAWTWFTDDRAIVDPTVDGGPRLLVGSVAAGGGASGDIDVRWVDTASGESGVATLHTGLEQDDHDCPALLQRPDGRYLAVYSKHGSDPLTRWRVSARPHDPTDWRPERALDNGAGSTYANVYRLPNDAGGAGRTYCFLRATGWDPTCLVSTDRGDSWSRGGRLLRDPDGGERPYVRYAADGDRIHLLATEGHPRDIDNGIYHGVFHDGALVDASGAAIHDVIHGDDPPAPDQLTTVLAPRTTVGGAVLHRAWGIDLAVGPDGPVGVVQVRADDDWRDHRFRYATHDGDGWRTTPLARAGPGLYDDERDYTGLAAVDPVDPSRVVVSTPIDPRDGDALDRHELFLGRTPNAGDDWSWHALTPGASTDHLRPIIAASADRRFLAWMRGDYDSWVSWGTQAVYAEVPSAGAEGAGG